MNDPFIETNAFMAAMEDSEEGIREEVNKLNFHELRNLIDAADLLSDVAYPIFKEKREEYLKERNASK